MQYDVCIVTTIHGDFDNRIYQRQASALLDAGMRVCIVAPWDFSRRSRHDFDFVRTTSPRNRAARILHAIRTYRAARGVNSAAYIFHDPDFLPFGWFLCRVTRRPVIYDCHENVPEEILFGKDWIPSFLRVPGSKIYRAVENGIVRSLGRALVVVPHQLRRFRRLRIDVLLVRNFSNFVVPANFQRDRAVLYTGDLTRDYGVYNLIGIAREMKKRGIDVPLRIVDRFYNDEVMRREIQGVVLDETLNVEFLKSVLAEDMAQILSQGCIGLSPLPDLPNKRIAYPTKIFEYFAFGLVVIASDIPGTREILEDGKLGILLKPEDYVGWVDEIERLLADQEYFNHYAASARAAIVEKYNWDRERKNLIDYVRIAAHEGV